MSHEPIRVGVIGAGIGAAHLAGYNALPGVAVLGLADLNDERAHQVAATYDVPQTFHDYEDLLARPTSTRSASACRTRSTRR